MSKTLEKKREALKKQFEKVGISLEATITYWGTQVKLKDLIPKMGVSDFKDAKSMIINFKEFKKLEETNECPLCKGSLKTLKKDHDFKYECPACSRVWADQSFLKGD